MQIAKITRPFLLVTPMTRNEDVTVGCKPDEALVLDSQNRTVSVFKSKDGLYVANMSFFSQVRGSFSRQDR